MKGCHVSDETLIERTDGLVTVTFNRPDRKNAFNGASWEALDRVIEEVWHNPRDRALVLTGAGGNFSSGADLSGGLQSNPDAEATRERESMLYEMRRVGEILNRLHRLPKPTLAAVDGVAIGVSLGIALACDLVIATDRAKFCEVFVRRGLSLDGGTSWTLPRHVGLRRAKQIAFFGDMIGADEALAWGLINEVVEPDQLQSVAREWGDKLASGPTTAISLMKRMLDSSSTLSFDQALEEEARSQHIAFTTADLAEGMRAFLERRPPSFTGV
jgi:2-(1,2-epoxy-1,2-dihydrophenyl)acetyl-CoA isomerase